MKSVFKGTEPPLLRDYLQKNPADDWKSDFKPNCPEGAKEVAAFLRGDQRGLCAYCENDLRLGKGVGLDDFRVEHFFPENPAWAAPIRSPNYALMWQNMLGCCTGGNQRGVTDSQNRFTQGDYSCDVEKGNSDWTRIILNPLTDILPEYHIFMFDDQTAEIDVNNESCPQQIKQKAKDSISKLRLNSRRLKKFREEVLVELKDQLIKLELEAGYTEDEALEEAALALFPDQSDQEWPKFFSMLRWYLGESAEARLHKIGYLYRSKEVCSGLWCQTLLRIEGKGDNRTEMYPRGSSSRRVKAILKLLSKLEIKR